MFVYALQIDYLVFISCIELNNVYIDIYKLLIPERLIFIPLTNITSRMLFKMIHLSIC